MPKKVIVLGSGRMGHVIATDLCADYEVTAVDLDIDALKRLTTKGIETRHVDLCRPGVIRDQVTGYDLAIGALPGHLGYHALSEVIDAGVDLVDISFMPEDYFDQDERARQKEITAVVDCGVAPGLGNLILGHYDQGMPVDSFRCYVGGLPLVREWPFEYKAVFSPMDVIEEYTRPARFVENGKLRTQEALSGVEMMEFTRPGTLEAWNSDGLRSLLVTMKIPDMIEKTLRYPGTTDYIRVLRETGFFFS